MTKRIKEFYVMSLFLLSLPFFCYGQNPQTPTPPSVVGTEGEATSASSVINKANEQPAHDQSLLSCAKFNDAFIRCSPFYCVENPQNLANPSSSALLYKEIKGLEAKGCRYEERSSSGKKTCYIPKEEIPQFMSFFIDNPDANITKNKEEFMGKFCTIDMTPFNPETEQSVNNEPSWIGSAMFDADMLRLLKDSMSAGTVAKNGIDYLNKAKTQLMDSVSGKKESRETKKKNLKPLPREKVPSYVLCAILFDNARNWNIWLNNHKIAEQKNQIFGQEGDLHILKVTDDNVVIRFQTSILDFLSPDWKTKLITEDNLEFFSHKKDIIVKSKEGVVTVTLSLGEAFILYDMKIVDEYEVNHGKALTLPPSISFTLPTLQDVMNEAEQEAAKNKTGIEGVVDNVM